MKIVETPNAFEAVALQEENPETTPPRTATPPDSHSSSRAQAPVTAADRLSPDPMRETDRYQLVTPYFSSSRDL